MKELVDRWQTRAGVWLAMRPMRPSDAPLVKESLNKLSANARRSRFFASIGEFSDDTVRQLVTVDPQQACALLVLRTDSELPTPIAGGRFVRNENAQECSVSVLVGDAWQGQGIGRRIIQALLREASRRGLRQMTGQVLADNQAMLRLARSLHFVVLANGNDDGVLRIIRDIPDERARQRGGLLGRVFRS